MIRLRKLEPTDLPFLYQWENDSSAWADSDTHNPLSRQDLRAYIESTTGDIYRDGQLRLMICEDAPSVEDSIGAIDAHNVQTPQKTHSPSSTTIGCIDLFDFDVRNRKAAIGMYVAPEARRRGVGHEAVRQLLRYAFDFLHLRMLYAIVRVTNEPSSCVYKDLGFIPSAVLHNWVLEGDAVVWQKCCQPITDPR